MASSHAERDQRWWLRVRGFIRRHRALHVTWRLLVFLVGSAVLVAGLVMFVTPGPGWLAVIAGLAILATEFAWAEGLLAWARRKAGKAKDKALDPAQRRTTFTASALCLVLAAGLASWWVLTYGYPPLLTDAWKGFIDWL